MSGDREYEIKATFDPDVLPSILAHPLLIEALREAVPAQMLATYYDTEGCDLWLAGFSLRIRKTSDTIVQTLKQAGAAILDRGEWEWTRDADDVDFDVLAKTPLGPHLGGLGGAIGPRFVVDVARTRFNIGYATTQVEGALDQGTIQGGGQSVPVCEIELELKHGAPRDVVALARLLVEDLPLVPSVASKAARGFRLIQAERPHPRKGLHVAVPPGAPVHVAIATIVAACVRAIGHNSALIATGARMEAVHQTRVAVRRLRAALLLFKPMIDAKRGAHVQAELKWISGLLGAARDCDVHQSDVFDALASDRAAPFGSAQLADVMRGVQADAHAALAQALRTARWRHLLLDLIAAPLPHDAPETRAPFEPYVVKRLKSRHEHLAGMAEHLRDETPGRRHDIRKTAKALRYAYSFFDPVSLEVRGKPFRRTLKALGTLQETLGTLHDRDALRDMLRRHVEDTASSIHRQTEDARTASIFAAGALTERPVKQTAMLAKAERAFRKIRAATKL